MFNKKTLALLCLAFLLLATTLFSQSSTQQLIKYSKVLEYFENGQVSIQAGAGIVAKSHDERELQEVNNKLGALKKAIILAESLEN